MISNSKWIILIVDDEECIHENLKEALSGIEHVGRDVELVHTGSVYEAKKILKEHPEIAIVILGVMAERDRLGLSFVRFLREEVRNEYARVLLHTAKSDIASKREVFGEYVIDGYLDKNTSDDDEFYVAVLLALKSHEKLLEVNESSKEGDVTLLNEIAQAYVRTLKDSKFFIEYGRVTEMVNSIFHLTQEVLASYVLKDLINNLKLGTTKMQRLSREEYRTLVSIRHIKILLNHTSYNNTSIEDYERDGDVIFHTILKEAQKFAAIKILPGKTKAYLDSCLLFLPIN